MGGVGGDVRVVPWVDRREWELLAQWLYPEKHSGPQSAQRKEELQRRAVARIASYRLRGSQYLPHAVDSTAQLLHCLLEEPRLDSPAARLACSMALVRFVNGLLDHQQQAVHAIPLHLLAAKVSLPAWLVDVRHAGTHDRDLPSLQTLRMGCRHALEWLWTHYWLEQSAVVEPPSSSSSTLPSELPRLTAQISRAFATLAQNDLIAYDSYYHTLSRPINIIKSKNFTVESDGSNTTTTSTNNNYTVIQKNFKLLQKIWKNIQDHEPFYENLLQFCANASNNYPVLIKHLVRRFSSFHYDFIRYLLSSSQYTPLHSKSLKYIIRYTNQDTILEHWESYQTIINSSQQDRLRLKLCQLLSSHLSQVPPTATITSFLQENIQKLQKPVQAPLSTTASILTDLSLLKAKTNELQSKKAVIKANNTPQSWSKIANWSPKPFGVL